MANLPKIKQLPQLNTPQPPLVPVIPTVKFPEIRVVKPKVEPLVFDYNDPNQINSVADIFRRQAARIIDAPNPVEKIKAQLLGWMPMFQDTYELVSGSIAPLFKEDAYAPGQKAMGFGINLLINFGETMDILANPIKGGLADGLAGIEAAGRGKNYDINTGHGLLVDVGAELLVDPLNWATLGGKGIISGVAKTSMKAAIKEAGFTLTGKKANRLAKQLLNNWQGDLDATVAKHFAKRLDDDAVKALRKAELDATSIKVLNALSPVVNTVDFLEGKLAALAVNTGAMFSPVALQFLSNRGPVKYAVAQLNETMRKYNPRKNLDTVSFYLSLPEVQLRLNSMEDIDNHDDLLAYVLQQGNSAVRSDLLEFRDILVNRNVYKDVPAILAKVDESIANKGYSFDEYYNAVSSLVGKGMGNRNLRQLKQVLDNVNEMRAQVDVVVKAAAVEKQLDDMADYLTDMFKYLTKSKVVYKVLNEYAQTVVRSTARQLKKGDLVDIVGILGDMKSALNIGEGDETFDWFEESLFDLLDNYKASRRDSDALGAFQSEVNALVDFYYTNTLEYRGLTGVDAVRQYQREVASYLESEGATELVPVFHDSITQTFKKHGDRVSLRAVQDIHDRLLGSLDSLKPDLDIKRVLNKTATQHLDTIDTILKKFNMHQVQDIIQAFIRDGIIKQRKFLFNDELANKCLVSKPHDMADVVAYTALPLEDRFNTELDFLTKIVFPHDTFVTRIQDVVDDLASHEYQTNLGTLVDHVVVELESVLHILNRSLESAWRRPDIDEIQAAVPLVEHSLTYFSALRDALVTIDDSNISPSVVAYTLKTSQIDARFRLYDNEDLVNLIQDVRMHGDLSRGLNVMLQDIRKNDPHSVDVLNAIANVFVQLEAMDQSLQLYGRILDMDIPDNMRYAWFDAIERQAKLQYSSAMGNRKRYVFKDIADNIENYINNSVVKERSSLDALYLRERVDMDRFIADKYGDAVSKLHSHDALYDIAKTDYLAHKLGVDTDGAFLLDIETTGLGAGDVITQIAVRGPSGELHNFKARPPQGIIPSRETMLKLLNIDEEAIGGIADDSLVKMYQELFNDTTDTEADILERLVDLLNAHEGDLRIIGHNIAEFDMRKLRSRLLYNRMYATKLPFAEVIDTLPLFQEQLGYFALSADQRKLVYDTMQEYAELAGDGHYTEMLTLWQNADELPDGYVVPQPQFIATPDESFAQSIQAIQEYVHQKALKGSAEMRKAYNALAQGLGNTARNLYDHLRGVRAVNKSYSEYFIDADEAAAFIGRGNSPEAYTANITALLQSNNVDLIDGLPQFKSIQSLAVRKAFDRKALSMFYTEYAWGTSMLLDKQRTLRRLNFYRDSITDMVKFSEIKESELRAYVINLAGKNLDGFVLHTEDKRTLFAIAVELYNRIPIKARPVNTKLEEFLNNPALLAFSANPRASQIAGNMNFFVPTHSSEIVAEGAKYYHDVKNIATEMDRLNKSIDLKEKYGIHAPKFYTTVTMMQQGYALFDEIDAALNKIKGLHAGVKDKAAMYNDIGYLKDALFEAHITDAKHLYERLVSSSVEGALSYLYHNAMGLVAIHSSVIERYEYGLDHIVSLAKRLEPYGVRLTSADDTVFLYIHRDADVSSIKYIQQEGVSELNLSSPFKEIAPQLKRIESSARSIRDTLGQYAPTSIGSSLERIGVKDLEEAHKVLPKDVLDVILPKEHFIERNFFSTTNYNFSFIGNYEFKKMYLPFISANPFKNYYTALRELAERNDTVMKYTSALLDNTADLSSNLFDGISDEQLYAILKNQGEFRVGMLVDDAKQGYKLKQVRIGSVKDVAFARRVGASVMPIELYSKSASVINDYRFTNDMVRWFDRYFAGPTKLGQLGTIGFLMRNVLDSTMKNIVDAESLDIIPHTYEMARMYMHYTTALQTIIKDYHHFNKETIEAFFESGKAKLTRDQFKFVHEFINDGTSGGMSKVLEDYMNDTFAMLHRTVPEDLKAVIDKDTIQRFIKGGSIIQDASNYAEDVYAELLRLKDNYKYTLRANAMRQHTKHVELHLDNLILFQKRPALLPTHLQKEWARLQKYAADIDALEQSTSVVYNNPFVKSLMSANGFIEHVSRLSAYSYDLMYRGGTKSSAAHRVIKTHQDPQAKNLTLKALEMVFPFITFGFRNAMYWADAVSSKGWLLGVARDIGAPIFNLDEYTAWDLENRMSLQFQILSGNVVLDQASGLTLKINPSIMDAFKALYDPAGMVLDKLQPILKNPLSLITKSKDGVDMDSLYIAKQVLGMVPLAGPIVSRYLNAHMQAEDTGSPLHYLAPSIFGRTKLPPDRLPYNPWIQRRAYRKNRYTKVRKARKFYVRKSYGRKVYPASKAAYNAVKFKRITNVPGYALFMRRLGRSQNLYTKKGANKIMLLTRPTTPKNVQYKLSLLWSRW